MRRPTSLPTRARQRGVAIFAIVLTVLAIVAALSYYAVASSRGDANKSAAYSARAYAGALMEQASVLHNAFTTAVADGRVELLELQLDETPVYGLYHPDVGGIARPEIAAKATADGAPGSWGYVLVTMDGLAFNNLVVYASQLSAETCKALNRQLRGTENIASLTLTPALAPDIVVASNAEASADVGVADQCWSTPANGNVFIHVLQRRNAA